jgi:Leucine-rich repeat (LRR) protein
MLSINDFIVSNNNVVNTIYIDKFFINLRDDIDIYLDYELIKCFGCEGPLKITVFPLLPNLEILSCSCTNIKEIPKDNVLPKIKQILVENCPQI